MAGWHLLSWKESRITQTNVYGQSLGEVHGSGFVPSKAGIALKSLQRKQAFSVVVVRFLTAKILFTSIRLEWQRLWFFPLNRRIEKCFQWSYCQSSGDGLHEVPSKFRKIEHQSLPRLKKKKKRKDFFRMKNKTFKAMGSYTVSWFLLGLGRLRVHITLTS